MIRERYGEERNVGEASKFDENKVEVTKARRRASRSGQDGEEIGWIGKGKGAADTKNGRGIKGRRG